MVFLRRLWLHCSGSCGKLRQTEAGKEKRSEHRAGIRAAKPSCHSEKSVCDQRKPIATDDPAAEPSIEMPEVAIEADEAVPDTRLVPDVSAVDDEVRVVKDDSGDVDDEDNVAGIAAEVRGVDSAEVSGDTVCAPVPAEVPAACATAAACPPTPAGLVVCSGDVNGVNVDAAEAAPA